MIKSYAHCCSIVVRCAIWYHLYNLKNVKNTHGGVLILVTLQALASQRITIFISPFQKSEASFPYPYSRKLFWQVKLTEALLSITLRKILSRTNLLYFSVCALQNLKFHYNLWTQDVNQTWKKRSEDVQNIFWTSYGHTIYVLYPGVNVSCESVADTKETEWMHQDHHL